MSDFYKTTQATKDIQFALEQGGDALISEAIPYETRIHVHGGGRVDDQARTGICVKVGGELKPWNVSMLKVSNIDWICEDTESGEAVASGSFDYWRLDEGADRLAKEINEHVPKHCFKDNVPTPIDPKRERLEGITPVMIHGVPVYFEPISDDQTYGGSSYVIDGAGMHESGSPDPAKWKPTTWKDLKDGWVKWATESEAVKGKAEKLLRVEIGSLGWFSGRIGTRNLNRAHGLILLDTMHALRVIKK